MKHECEGLKRVIDGIKQNYPEHENIAPPMELLSGRIYLSFTAGKPFRGKKKQVEIPVLLSKCPFCGEKYKDEGEAKQT